MRRTTYYMGHAFSQRHLNAVRSPLQKGFINTSHLSSTSSIMKHGIAGSAAFACASLPASSLCVGGAGSCESEICGAAGSGGGGLMLASNTAAMQRFSTFLLESFLIQKIDFTTINSNRLTMMRTPATDSWLTGSFNVYEM